MLEVYSIKSLENPSSLLFNPSNYLKQIASSKSIIFNSPSLLKDILDGLISRWATLTDFK